MSGPLVAALAGGIGAGKFLRGLVRAVPPAEVAVVVNTADDVEMHGLHVSPDLDSVTYWLGDVHDRERGWGRRGDTFRATEELRRFDPEAAWFNLGDLDLATHLFRTRLLREGLPLSEITARVAGRFGVDVRILPMSDDPVTTRVRVLAEGRELELHFQEYWVRRGARDEVKGVRYAGAETARPAPGVLQALREAGTVVICPSNPVASIGPILAVPGMREVLAERRDRVVGISGIVGGAPLAGMADKLLPAVGAEVSAVGVAACYRGLLGALVIDEADRDLAPRIEAMGVRVGVTDTIMSDDVAAERLARFALDLLG
ncbi:MAG: 2-phospho-L-lactate transferase [Actinomycetota bacterium]|nr:MAG: 2-phospho-L-lactate transferase [Actinomycetota bacterium]